jgi:hypothetical protein
MPLIPDRKGFTGPHQALRKNTTSQLHGNCQIWYSSVLLPAAELSRSPEFSSGTGSQGKRQERGSQDLDLDVSISGALAKSYNCQFH